LAGETLTGSFIDQHCAAPLAHTFTFQSVRDFQRNEKIQAPFGCLAAMLAEKAKIQPFRHLSTASIFATEVEVRASLMRDGEEIYIRSIWTRIQCTRDLIKEPID